MLFNVHSSVGCFIIYESLSLYPPGQNIQLCMGDILHIFRAINLWRGCSKSKSKCSNIKSKYSNSTEENWNFTEIFSLDQYYLATNLHFYTFSFAGFVTTLSLSTKIHLLTEILACSIQIKILMQGLSPAQFRVNTLSYCRPSLMEFKFN